MLDAVAVVSLGPGDPELITLRGLNTLNKADYIFCPATTLSGDVMISRSKDILSALNIDDTKIITFSVPMSENRIQSIENYNKVAGEVEEKYRAGYKVAVVAEGDAGFYSSSYYISEILDTKNIPVDRIAGVPAFIACAASHNICISKQKEEVDIVTHLLSKEELQGKIRKGRTVVLMKASQFEGIVKETLNAAPEDVTYHYFENSGLAGKEFYTNRKADICNRHFPYFSLLIIQ